MNEIEIEHQCYCSEHGMFCQFLDKKSGLCIATSCKRAQEILYEIELAKQAEVMAEIKDAKRVLYDIMLERYESTNKEELNHAQN